MNWRMGFKKEGFICSFPRPVVSHPRAALFAVDRSMPTDNANRNKDGCNLPKQTCASALRESALGGKADMPSCTANVCL